MDEHQLCVSLRLRHLGASWRVGRGVPSRTRNQVSQLENRVTTRTGFLAAAQQAAQDSRQDAGILMGTGGTNEMSCGDFLGDDQGRAV
jgi:hypothetical protein